MFSLLLCLRLSFRPPLQLHSTVQHRHSPLRASDQSLIHPPPLRHPGPRAAPLQGSDHPTWQRESGHPGAPWAMDGDGHHRSHPAGEEPERGGTLDPHGPVLVHRACVCQRQQQPLVVVDSREKKMERGTTSGSPVSSFIPGGRKGGEGLDGGLAGRKHHEANRAVASLDSPPPPLQRRFKLWAQRWITGCSEKCPCFHLFLLFHLLRCLHRFWYPWLQTQNWRAQEPLQAPLLPAVLRRARLGSLLHRSAGVQPTILQGQLPAGAPLRLPFPQPRHHPDGHQRPGRRGRPPSIMRTLQVHAHERAGRTQEEGGVQGAAGHGGRVVHVSLKQTWMTRTCFQTKRGADLIGSFVWPQRSSDPC